MKDVFLLLSAVLGVMAVFPYCLDIWRDPFEETWQTYATSVFTVSLGIIGLEVYDFINLVYPVYLFILCVLLTVIILYRRPLVKSWA